MSKFSRRRFLGLSAMVSAVALGSTTIGLSGCSKDSIKELDLGGDKTDYQAVIIGSGYAGAVAALRLGESGVKTLLIEMGKAWGPHNGDNEKFEKLLTLTPQPKSSWRKTKTILPFGPSIPIAGPKYVGVLDRVDFPTMGVYMGRGLGGGSLVNGGMAVTPNRSFFEEILPNVDADEMYSKYFPMANNMLQVNEISDEFYNTVPFYKFSREAEADAHAAGYQTAKVPNVYDFNYMEQEYANEVPRSAFDYEVLYGNNGGKATVDKNYIADAIGTGNVTIATLQKVEEIHQNADESYRLEVSRLSTSGLPESSLEYTCKHLFLAAGTVGTNQLLVKAREKGTLANLNADVGENFGPNGNIMFGRNTLKRPRGVKQSTIPTRGIVDLDNPFARTFAEIAPIPLGFELRYSLYLAITITETRGKFIYDPSTEEVILDWPIGGHAQGVEAVKHLAGRMNDVNGGELDFTLLKDGPTEDFTYHPLGGCILGEASDMYGRLKGHKNLYAIDGSTIPGNTSVNPFVTITALAERAMEKIIKEDIVA